MRLDSDCIVTMIADTVRRQPWLFYFTLVVAAIAAKARNTVVWNQQGNMVCVGGFGSLSGRMDFYHVSAAKKSVAVKLIKYENWLSW